MSLKDLNADEVSRREVYPERAPAGPTPPADGWPVGKDTYIYEMIQVREGTDLVNTVLLYLSVVVENDNDTSVDICGVIHGFVRHATGDGSVADDSDAIVHLLREQVLAHGHALQAIYHAYHLYI